MLCFCVAYSETDLSSKSNDSHRVHTYIHTYIHTSIHTYIQVHTYIHSAGKGTFVIFVQVMYPNDTGQGPNNYTPL